MFIFIQILLILLSCLPNTAQASLIRNMQKQIWQNAATNKRLESELGNLKGKISHYESEVSTLNENLSILNSSHQAETDALSSQISAIKSELRKLYDRDRYVYDVIDETHLEGLRQFAKANPDLPVLLQLQRGRIVKVESFSPSHIVNQRIDDLVKRLRSVSLENHNAAKRLKKLEDSTSSLSHGLNQIYDFSGASPLIETGSGEDAVFLKANGLSHFNPAEEIFGQKLDKLDDFCRKKISKIENVIKTFSTRSDLTHLSADLLKTKEQMKKLDKGIIKAAYNLSGLALSINKTVDRLKKSTVSLSHDIMAQTRIVDVVKAMQSSYFTELQNFGNRLNLQETDLLKYGLKLGHLQTDILNLSLTFHKEEHVKLGNKIENQKLEDSILVMSKHIEQIQTKQENIQGSLKDLASKAGLSSLSDKLETYDSYLRSHRGYFMKLSQKVVSLVGSVDRLETTLDKFCRANGKEIQLIKPLSSRRSFSVRCSHLDDSRAAGPWLVIQNRNSKNQSFNQTYSDYEVGFGNLSMGNFWLGNQYLYHLTASNPVCLQIEMTDIFGDRYVASYESFAVKERKTGYELQVSGYTGNATDALGYHSGMKFSAYDRDQDASSTDCAKFYNSGWWYAHCQRANLNGAFSIGIVWFHAEKQSYLQLIDTEMKIRDHC